MSRKHNTKHQRSVSNYPARLRARGETPASVRMPFIDKYGRHHDTVADMLRAEGKRPKAELEVA